MNNPVGSNNLPAVIPVAPATMTAIERAKLRLAELTAAKKAAVQAAAAELEQRIASSNSLVPNLGKLGWWIDDSKEWNQEQLNFIHAGLAGRSLCYIGAAGTGKTSGLKGLVASLIRNNLVRYISPAEGTKWLRPGVPGIVMTSFTNMAVRQIAKHFDRSITCVTLHKLLEFGPVFYEVEAADGTIKKTMRFEPGRNKYNKLPRSLRTIVIDEASMVDIPLVAQLIDALPDPESVQWIIVGDLHQLPPVYGRAILGKKLLELPIVELTRVYRQALLSPIITLAHKMKNGESIPVGSEQQVIDAGEHGKLTIHPWKKLIIDEDACNLAANHMKASILHNLFDPFQDIILIPKNVAFGQLELNRNLADWLGRQRKAVVHEVVAGFLTHYYAIGDKVLVNKREALIVKIQRNREYSGKRPMNADLYEIDRWGGAKKRSIQNSSASDIWEAENSDTDVDAILASLAATNTVVEDRKQACSHIITVRFLNGTVPSEWDRDGVEDDVTNCETYETYRMETAGEVNEMLFAYAITVHKSQGSEWRKVYFILHQTHQAMCSRELLYTGITRAREELYIICEPDRGMKSGTLTNGAKKPRIKGNTLAEKLSFLKEKFAEEEREQQKKDAKKKSEEDDE